MFLSSLWKEAEECSHNTWGWRKYFPVKGIPLTPVCVQRSSPCSPSAPSLQPRSGTSRGEFIPLSVPGAVASTLPPCLGGEAGQVRTLRCPLIIKRCLHLWRNQPGARFCRPCCAARGVHSWWCLLQAWSNDSSSRAVRGSFNRFCLWLNYMIPPIQWMIGYRTESALFLAAFKIIVFDSITIVCSGRA